MSALETFSPAALPASGTAGTIAWLNSWSQPEKLRASRIFDGYWRGATEVATQFGFAIEEHVVGKEAPLANVLKTLTQRTVHAMLIPPIEVESITPEWADASLWEKFAAVRLGHSSPHPAFHIVTPDQAGNTRFAFNKMQERGYRRIGFIASQHAAQHLLFKAGFLLAQLEVDARLRIPPLVLDPAAPDQGRSALLTWLERTSPDAILTDLPFVRMLLVAEGYRVPDQMGLAVCSVAKDKHEAGIFENAEEIGRVAVLTVLSLMQSETRGIPEVRYQTLVGGHWIDGETLPPRS